MSEQLFRECTATGCVRGLRRMTVKEIPIYLAIRTPINTMPCEICRGTGFVPTTFILTVPASLVAAVEKFFAYIDGLPTTKTESPWRLFVSRSEIKSLRAALEAYRDALPPAVDPRNAVEAWMSDSLNRTRLRHVLEIVDFSEWATSTSLSMEALLAALTALNETL